MSYKTMIIAEAGVNHNGSVEIAKKICDAAKDAGADVVKFQTWITDKIITKQVKKAEYQTTNTKNEESQYSMLKKLELSFDEFREIKKYCDEIGITFASTADEEDSLDFLIDLGIPFIKIGSGEIGNVPFLRYVGKKQLPVVISTGMSTIADVDCALRQLEQGGTKDITVLHCTTNYPCPYDEVNLNAMNTLKNTFGYEVGFSDHTVGIEVPVAAVANGARIIEKHFTLDKTMDGPDHIASMEPAEFKKMVEAIRNVEKAMGSKIKRPTLAETHISKVVKKRIVAKNQIIKGQIISEKDICVKRSDCGVPSDLWDYILGITASRDYQPDEGIEV